MALITCPECKRPGVSDTAKACPGCGASIATRSPSVIVGTGGVYVTADPNMPITGKMVRNTGRVLFASVILAVGVIFAAAPLFDGGKGIMLIGLALIGWGISGLVRLRKGELT